MVRISRQYSDSIMRYSLNGVSSGLLPFKAGVILFHPESPSSPRYYLGIVFRSRECWSSLTVPATRSWMLVRNSCYGGWVLDAGFETPNRGHSSRHNHFPLLSGRLVREDAPCLPGCAGAALIRC